MMPLVHVESMSFSTNRSINHLSQRSFYGDLPRLVLVAILPVCPWPCPCGPHVSRPRCVSLISGGIYVQTQLPRQHKQTYTSTTHLDASAPISSPLSVPSSRNASRRLTATQSDKSASEQAGREAGRAVCIRLCSAHTISLCNQPLGSRLLIIRHLMPISDP